MKNSHVISSYKGAQEALRNGDLRQSLYDAGDVIMRDTLLVLHGAEHRQRRVAEFGVFTRGFFRFYEKEIFPNTLVPTLKPFLKAGGSDLVDIGYRVTINLTADFSGVDRPENSSKETDKLIRLVKKFSEGATMVHSQRNPDELNAEVREALKEFNQEFFLPSRRRREALIERYRNGDLSEEDLSRDVMTTLLLRQDDLKLSDDLFLREIAFFMQAGAHSTANSTVHAFHEISEWCKAHPEDCDRLLTEPLFLQRCVHESIRLKPASPVAWRQAACPHAMDATGNLDAGEDVIVDIAAANRDQSVFGVDADVFNPSRDLPRNVWPFGMSFGYGVHACMGRDLDGGIIPKPNTDPADHQYGIVTLYLRALLENGAVRDPDKSPTADSKTSRPNWAYYPVILK